jgi:hypothetical protein
MLLRILPRLAFVCLLVFLISSCVSKNDLVRLQAPEDIDDKPLAQPLSFTKYHFEGEYRQVYGYIPTTQEMVTSRQRLVFEKGRQFFRHYVGKFENGSGYGYTMHQDILLVNNAFNNWELETDGKFLRCSRTGALFAPAKDFASR